MWNAFALSGSSEMQCEKYAAMSGLRTLHAGLKIVYILYFILEDMLADLDVNIQ